jgi:hypothetical protein
MTGGGADTTRGVDGVAGARSGARAAAVAGGGALTVRHQAVSGPGGGHGGPSGRPPVSSGSAPLT